MLTGTPTAVDAIVNPKWLHLHRQRLVVKHLETSKKLLKLFLSRDITVSFLMANSVSGDRGNPPLKVQRPFLVQGALLRKSI